MLCYRIAHPLVLVAVDPRSAAVTVLQIFPPFSVIPPPRLVLRLGGAMVESHVRLGGTGSTSHLKYRLAGTYTHRLRRYGRLCLSWYLVVTLWCLVRVGMTVERMKNGKLSPTGRKRAYLYVSCPLFLLSVALKLRLATRAGSTC